jgi:hypothetical protein
LQKISEKIVGSKNKLKDLKENDIYNVSTRKKVGDLFL